MLRCTWGYFQLNAVTMLKPMTMPYKIEVCWYSTEIKGTLSQDICLKLL